MIMRLTPTLDQSVISTIVGLTPTLDQSVISAVVGLTQTKDLKILLMQHHDIIPRRPSLQRKNEKGVEISM
jgi:hypothetical protein